jgi:hypothetical protein
MKKIFTFLLIIFSITSQSLHAQLDLAFVSNFSGIQTNSSNRLNWTIANNRAVQSFEIEKSTDAKEFKVVAIVLATEKYHTEDYTYTDTAITAEKIMYRLRIVNKRQNDFYSRIILVRSKMTLDNNVRIVENPVRDRLCFNFSSAKVQQVDIKIYSITGKILIVQKIGCSKGSNLLTIPLSTGFVPGIYVLQVNNDIVNQAITFVKH